MTGSDHDKLVAQLRELATQPGVAPVRDGDVKRFVHPLAQAATDRYRRESPLIFVNGMLNNPIDHAMAALATSWLHMKPVIGVYNLSVSGLSDFFQCVGDKINFSSVDPRLIYQRVIGYANPAQAMREALARNPAQLALFDLLRRPEHRRTPIHAHSQGNLITANALTAIAAVDRPGAIDGRKVYSYGSPTYFWPPGLDREENAFIFDPVSWLGSVDEHTSYSTVGMPEGSLNPITHAFLEYVRNDAAFFVNRYRSGALGVTWDMDEEGLAQALVGLGYNFRRVNAIMRYLDSHESTDSDDVALEYVNRVRDTPLGRQVRLDAPLRETLIRVMDEGITFPSEHRAIEWLRAG